MSSVQQDSVEVPIPPAFLGIFRDFMITFWNYTIAKLNEQGKKELNIEIIGSNLTEMEYLKFSGINIDDFCEILTEIIEYEILKKIISEVIKENKNKYKYKKCKKIIIKIKNKINNKENLIQELDNFIRKNEKNNKNENKIKCKEIIKEIKNLIQELDNFIKNNKEILFKLCKFSLSLQKESNISGKTNITVRFGARNIGIAKKFSDLIHKEQKEEYYEIKDKGNLEKINIKYNKLPKKPQKDKKKEKESVNIFFDLLKKECKDFIGEYNSWFRRVAYEFGRGFAIENLRGKIQLEIFADLECKLIYEIPIFIRIAQELTEVKINERKTGIYILMSEIYKRDYEILNWFFNEELEKLKNYVGKIIYIYLKKYNDIPLIYDLIQELLLLDIVYESLRKSMAYVYRWPSLRIYYLHPKLRGFIVIDIPPSLIEIANLAVKSSAEKLHIPSMNLLNTIRKLVDKMKNETTQSEISINDLYIFIHTVLQGNPDIDLFYKLERSIYSMEGQK